jgi:glycosyltransferase involved in cell wall biosynthesis
MDSNRILLHVCLKDRPTELGLLLQSLRTQTYQNFDVLILNDGSGTPPMGYYFIQYIVMRMQDEGHYIHIIDNPRPSGVSGARQQLVEYTMKNLPHKLICRVDDDVILEPDYLEELKLGLDEGYDLMSGITTPVASPRIVRDVKHVSPIIGYCEFDNEGSLVANFDDCGHLYNKKAILLTHHFRSCALYKRELHEKGVNYINNLSRNGFREEQVFSFKAILAGFKLGVNTYAINYHLMTPSGGERDTMNMVQFNQEQFESWCKDKFKEHGDFLKAYNNKYGVEMKLDKEHYLKSNNLITRK